MKESDFNQKAQAKIMIDVLQNNNAQRKKNTYQSKFKLIKLPESQNIQLQNTSNSFVVKGLQQSSTKAQKEMLKTRSKAQNQVNLNKSYDRSLRQIQSNLDRNEVDPLLSYVEEEDKIEKLQNCLKCEQYVQSTAIKTNFNYKSKKPQLQIQTNIQDLPQENQNELSLPSITYATQEHHTNSTSSLLHSCKGNINQFKFQINDQQAYLQKNNFRKNKTPTRCSEEVNNQSKKVNQKINQIPSLCFQSYESTSDKDKILKRIYKAQLDQEEILNQKEKKKQKNNQNTTHFFQLVKQKTKEKLEKKQASKNISKTPANIRIQVNEEPRDQFCASQIQTCKPNSKTPIIFASQTKHFSSNFNEEINNIESSQQIQLVKNQKNQNNQNQKNKPLRIVKVVNQQLRNEIFKDSSVKNNPYKKLQIQGNQDKDGIKIKKQNEVTISNIQSKEFIQMQSQTEEQRSKSLSKNIEKKKVTFMLNVINDSKQEENEIANSLAKQGSQSDRTLKQKTQNMKQINAKQVQMNKQAKKEIKKEAKQIENFKFESPLELNNSLQNQKYTENFAFDQEILQDKNQHQQNNNSHIEQNQNNDIQIL